MSKIEHTDATFLLFLETFAAYVAAVRGSTGLDLELQTLVDGFVEDNQAQYLTLSAQTQKLEEALKEFAKQNPGWFGTGKTLTTPHGAVKKKASRKLEIDSEPITLRLIKAKYGKKAAQFIRTTEEVNKEALESLKPQQLAALGVRHVEAESYTVEARKLDLGKAVASAAKAAEAEKAGKEAA